MVPKGISSDQSRVRRILSAGFDALGEYDAYGVLLASAGGLSSQFAWDRVASLAISGQGQSAVEGAVAIVLDDMFVAALGLEGGGTLLAIAERQVIGEAADELAKALDGAVTEAVGPKLAPWLLGAAAIGALYLISRGGSSS
jgi:hypothetical protein